MWYIQPIGRVADMLFIIFSIVTIPKMTNELFEKMKLQSVYARAAYTPRVSPNYVKTELFTKL